jgi:hypothetical protein
MNLTIARALAEFMRYVGDNFGQSIDLGTIRAFSIMVQKIITALQTDELNVRSNGDITTDTLSNERR